MIEHHLQKLRARDTVSPEEEQAIRDSIAEVRAFGADQILIHAGQVLNFSIMLLDGLLCRYKDLSDGQRQITELHVPGDFADLHSFTLKRLDHNIMTITPCRVAIVPHEKLEQITERLPHLTRLYWFTTNMDAAIHREWEVSLGLRSAIERMAHLFCELQVRLSIVDLADESGFAFGLTQAELGEATGLSTVHVNRTLQDLRAAGIIELKARRLAILDLAALMRASLFNPNYLHLDRAGHLDANMQAQV